MTAAPRLLPFTSLCSGFHDPEPGDNWFWGAGDPIGCWGRVECGDVEAWAGRDDDPERAAG
jgi:hypothetical protein